MSAGAGSTKGPAVSPAAGRAAVPKWLRLLQDRAAMQMRARLHEAAVMVPWREDGEDRWFRASLLVRADEHAARLVLRDARTAEFVSLSLLADWHTVDPAHWDLGFLVEDDLEPCVDAVTAGTAGRCMCCKRMCCKGKG